MKICFVADAHSTIALDWISSFLGRHEVSVLSSYPAPKIEGVERFHRVPIAFSWLVDIRHRTSRGANSPESNLIARALERSWLTLTSRVRPWLGPFEIPFRRRAIRDFLVAADPDVVHALRLPFEGIAAAAAIPPEKPLIVSTWGQDFVYWAEHFPLLARSTRRALGRCDALMADCKRDADLASQWGLDPDKPRLVVPGNGGVDTTIFRLGEPEGSLAEALSITDARYVIVNPRGSRFYVRNDVFLQAAARVAEKRKDVKFVGVAMEGDPVTESYTHRLGLRSRVKLTRPFDKQELAELFRTATVSVSPTMYDGTPNSMLEAMACGCFPVVSDHSSTREWITDGANGLLFDPTDVGELERALLRALDDTELRERAKQENAAIIDRRATRAVSTQAAEELYAEVVERGVR